jgi:NADH:ubiquinone oxidoreductase subunit H
MNIFIVLLYLSAFVTVVVIIVVVFLTLLQCSLSYIHVHNGYSGVGSADIFQPLVTQFKLFSKERSCPSISSKLSCYFSLIFYGLLCFLI